MSFVSRPWSCAPRNRIPFIFITGYATDPKIRHFLIEQEVKFLVKPFPIKGLISCAQDYSADFFQIAEPILRSGIVARRPMR